MSELFDKGKVNLPYGSADSQNKSNIYRRQLLYFQMLLARQVVKDISRI